MMNSINKSMGPLRPHNDITLFSGCSGDLLPPSPPAEEATARQDQARQSGAGDGTGDPAHATTRDSVVDCVTTVGQSFDALSQRFEVLNQPFDGLSRAMDKRFDATDQRFGEFGQVLGQRFDALSRIIDERLATINQRFAAIDQYFATMDVPLVRLETKVAEMDAQLARLETKTATAFRHLRWGLDIAIALLFGLVTKVILDWAMS
jgi:hypothetical protein